jgi:hypothetical protein
VKAEGPRLALVKDAAAFAYQVESVRPAGVSRLDPIVEAIYERGELDSQLAHTCAGNECAFNLVFRTAEEDVIANIGPHLPHISGMRFKNVNSVESDLVAILISQLVQGGNLPPKRRSRVAAKNQNDWTVRPKRSQISRTTILKLLHHQVRRGVTDV